MTFTDIYEDLYSDVFGSTPFPQGPLNLVIEMKPGTLGWTDITADALQREGTSPPVVITRGRPDETTQASPAQASFQLSNRGGNYTVRNPSGTWYGQLNKNTPLRVSVPGSASYLRIEDDSASYSAMPASGVLTNLAQDIRIDLTLSNWSPCTLISWWGGSGERAWLVTLNGDGTITFRWSNDGTASNVQSATSALPLPVGPVVLRLTFDHASGIVTWYTAAAGNISAGPWTQLGAPSAANASVTISPSTAVLSIGYNSTANADFGLPGLNGQVRDAQVRAAIGGTVLAQPAFSSQTAGTTSWADAEGNTWTLGGTAEISARSYRFHGEMSALPVAWDPTGRDVWTALTADGQLRRVQQGNASLPSPMKRAAALAASVVAYWPCEDQSGSAQIAAGLAGVAPMQIDGKPALAADTSFAGSGALPQMNGATFTGLVPAYAPTGQNAVRFLTRILAETPPPSFAIAQVKTTGTMAQIIVAYDPAGTAPPTPADFTAEAYDANGNTLSRTASFSTTAPGDYLISVEVTTSGGNVTLTLRAMDASGRVSSNSSAALAGSAGIVTSVVLNPARTADTTLAQSTDATSAGQVIVQSAAGSFASDWTGPVTAWSGETAGNRFARLCSENGFASRIYGYPDSSAPMGRQGQATLTQLLQECESADRGMIYEPRQALALGYRTLASMYNQAPAVTLDYSASELGQEGQPGEWAPVDDDQYTVNDVIATRGSSGGSQGSTYQAVLDDGTPLSISAPPAGVGDYQSAATLNVATDHQLASVASWMMHVGTNDDQRIPSLPLNLARPALASLLYDVQDADIGDRTAVQNPPSWLPPDDISQILTGTTEELGGFFYLAAWNAIPEGPYEVAVCGDHADTAGSSLAAPASSSAASVSVAVDTGPLWTTSAGDFPFDIRVGGERMTVTNITGTSSPQAFTVTRSVNGVVKSHLAGEAVALFTTPVAAL